MVYTTALLFGHGVPVSSEEESVVDMIGKYFSQLTSAPGRRTPSARRGSVESCDEKHINSPCKLLKSCVYVFFKW